MTKSNWHIMTLLLAATLAIQTGCNEDKPAAPAAPTPPAASTAPAAPAIKYTCTMHPEIVRDAPGNCPTCGMVLVEKK